MKHKKYCKFSVCIILILAICLCLGSCSSDVSDENDAPNESTDDSASDKHVCIYDEAPSLEFSTIEEFAGVLFDGKLTEEQKDMINKFPKDKNGQTLTFDLDNLQVPVLPENVSVKSITWTGESYCYFVGFDGGGHGTINYETNRKEVYTRRLSELDDIFKKDYITVTEQEFLDDGTGGEKTVIYYTTPVSSLKSIRYSLGDGNKVFVIEKVFCLEVNHSLIEVSDMIPYYIALFCEEGNEYYIIHLFSLTEDPSDEWLLEFGLTKYAGVSDSDSNDAVSLEDASKIQEGMKYSEIADILGSEGTDVGYGAVIYRWILADGEYVDVHFVASELSENKTLEDLVASKITFSKND